MAQKVIVENNSYRFWQKCNELLDAGWRVIPGTVETSVSASEAHGIESHNIESYVAFFTDGKDEN